MPSTPAAPSTPIPPSSPDVRPDARARDGLAGAAIHAGRRLAPGETVLWEGAPSWAGLARGAFHLPWVAGYFGALVALRLLAAGLGWGSARAALAPALPGLATLAILAALAALVARSTRYQVTSRRVILRYGVGLPRSLSIPLAQVASLAVAVGRDGRGDVALALRDRGRLSYPKLWPHARPWHLRRPEPMLRDVAGAGPLATRLARALAEAEALRAERAAAASPARNLSECPQDG